VPASALQLACSLLGSIPQHVASDAQEPVAPPLLVLPELDDEPLLDPLPLEVVEHSLEQFDCWQESTAEMALMQPDSWAFAWHAEDSAALSLNVPPGHSQFSKSLQPLSTPLTCEPHLLSTHDVHAWLVPLCDWAELMQALPPPPLLLEHANAASAAVNTPPATNNAFIIVADLPWKAPPPAGRRAGPH
jgi:hypothetical protein